jgi:hypothetical protein
MSNGNAAPPVRKSKYIAKDFFSYGLNLATIAAGVPATNTVTMDADSDFLWQKFCFFTDIAGAAQTESTLVIPLATITITDTGSGRQIMNVPIPLNAIAGRGALPFILPMPKIFPARATVSATVANFSAATTYVTPRLVFIGTKLFLA